MKWRLDLVRAVAVLLPLLGAVSYARADPMQGRAERARWLAERESWEDLPEVAVYVSSREPEIRANAVLAFGKIWDANLALAGPKRFDRWLDLDERRAVVEALENHFGVMGAADRKRSLQLVAGYRYDPGLMPLLLVGTTDPDASVRDTAQRLADRFLKGPDPSPMVLSDLVRFLERPNLPDKLVDAAIRQLDRADAAARTAAIGRALVDLAIRQKGAARALKVLHADDSPLAKLAGRVSELHWPYRSELQLLFMEQTRAGRAVLERAIPLLTSEDPEFRRLAGSFVAADRERCDPMLVVQACGDRGLPLAADALEAMGLDATSVCDHLAGVLKSPDSFPIARVAAAQTLKSVGLHGAAIRALGDSLLDDEDEEVRYIAAELFNRPDIMNLARVPGLVRELRDDSVTVRMSAANRLESLGVEPKEITDALIRAVKEGDMPAREGLLRAIERAYVARTNSLDVLRKLASDRDQRDTTTGVYARAALRVVAAGR